METKIKREIYILCAIALGVILGLIGYGLTEKEFIQDLAVAGIILPASLLKRFFLLPEAAAAFFLGGLMLGYALGVRWWQIVYVEKRHWRMRKENA